MSDRQRYATRPPQERALADSPRVVTGTTLLRSRTARLGLLAVLGTAGLAAAITAVSATGPGLSSAGRTTVVVFAAAVFLWVFTEVDDTYVALGAAVTLVLTGVLSTEELFTTLGDDTVWLLLAAFVIAAGVTQSGLSTRATAYVVCAARSPRGLFHLLTAALVVTTFAVPSTSGRAALAVPVFLVLARTFAERPLLVRALALLFPTVVLLSAVASLLGAGAHLVTSEVLTTATGSGISFVRWLLLGLPLGVVASHLAAEVVLLLFTSGEERAQTSSRTRRAR